MWFFFLQSLIICIMVLTIILWVVSRKKVSVVGLARAGNIVICCLTVFLYLLFIGLFITHQYQFQAVYQNSNNQMPWLLLISSSWAGQAGSLFLWLYMHSFTLLIALTYKKYQSFISLILLLNQAVILFLVMKAQPFEKTPVAFHDGIGLNPVLSHINMSIHPPFAFVGYALISLLFAFTIAHLLRPIDLEWLVKIKKWVYGAFFCLTCTIILGSVWAYSVLGWGGLWAFDAIENASLVTWILLMMLIHHINWFQKQKKAPHFSLLLIILTFASIYHMVMLLRSGLMEKLTQHAYLGDKLFTVLIMIDIVYFLLPFLLYCFRYNAIETDKEKTYYTSSPYLKNLFTFFLFCLSGILFIQINEPLLQNIVPIAFPPLSKWFLPLFYLLVLGFLLSNQIPFLLKVIQKHHHKIQLVSYTITSLFLAVLLTFLLVILSGKRINPSYWQIIFIFLSSLWIIESVQLQKKDSVKDLIDKATHIAISFLIISFTLSSTNTFSASIFLLPSDSIKIEETVYGMKNPVSKQKAYIGEKETYSIEMITPNKKINAYPTFWNYNRKSTWNLMKIPSIRRIGFQDIQTIPMQKDQIEFLGEEIIHFKNMELVITNRVYSQNQNHQDLSLISADLIIKQFNSGSTYTDPYTTEVLHLSREQDQLNVRFITTPNRSELLDTELHWRLSETNTILLQSVDWANGIQIDIVKKPFVIGVFFSYYLLLLLLGLRILFFRYKDWGKQYLFPSYHRNLRRKRHFHASSAS